MSSASESPVEFVAGLGGPFLSYGGVVSSDVAAAVCWEYPSVLAPFPDGDDVVPLHRIGECCGFAAEPADGTCPYPPSRCSPLRSWPPSFGPPLLMTRLSPLLVGGGVFGAAGSVGGGAAVEARFHHGSVAWWYSRREPSATTVRFSSRFLPVCGSSLKATE